jgi:hypothetical protein
MADPIEKINALRKEAAGRAAHQREINATEKRLVWNRLQIEAPDLAAFMTEAKAQLGAMAVEIKLGGKVVWEK